MTALTEAAGCFAREFAAVARPAGQDWFLPARRAAIDRFTALGFPATQDEEWRFTNVSPIAGTAFRPADGQATVPAAELKELLFDAHLLVFVNGRFNATLSQPDKLPDGVRIGSLGAAMTEGVEIVRAHLGKYARWQQDAFTALNTALAADGGFIQIGRGRAVERPIHLLFVSTPGSEPTACHPRTLIVAGEGSQATIVESYVGLTDGVQLTNAVTEIVAGENAIVDHYRIQRESERAYHIGAQYLNQARTSNVKSMSVSSGAAIARSDVTAVLDGEGCECTLNGLFMAWGTQHIDNHLRVEHARPHCDSREYYKGILDGKARGVFAGRILVQKDAQKTDAKQTNMNLLLSEEARIDTKPQLEIFADDVKCTHGATIGQIDADALFYLQSRGIGPAAARSMLIYAFANESLGQIRVDPVRRQLQDLLFARLPGGTRFEDIL